MTSLHIGRLAAEARVSADTVRYYERERLLPPPMRSASGYRVYPAAAIDRLKFIRRAKELGFSLDEIRDLLAVSDGRGAGVENVLGIATRRLADVEARLDELTRLRDGLRELVAACPGHGDLGACPILHAFRSDDDA